MSSQFSLYIHKLHQLSILLADELERDDLPDHTRQTITMFLVHYIRCQLEFQAFYGEIISLNEALSSRIKELS